MWCRCRDRARRVGLPLSSRTPGSRGPWIPASAPGGRVRPVQQIPWALRVKNGVGVGHARIPTAEATSRAAAVAAVGRGGLTHRPGGRPSGARRKGAVSSSDAFSPTDGAAKRAAGRSARHHRVDFGAGAAFGGEIRGGSGRLKTVA